MRKAILHIGTEKTGTTAIQHYLSTNRDHLDTAGFRYSISCGNSNHVKLAAYAQADEKLDDLRIAFNCTSQKSLNTFRVGLVQALAKEAYRFPGHTFVFSNEHCHSRLNNINEIINLKKLLNTFFEKIDVVVYLRRQDEMAVSLYTTMLKNGYTRADVLQADKASPLYYDHKSLLDRWSFVFGEEAISVGLFVRENLIDRSVISDFCSRTGIPLLAASASFANESLRPPYQEFLRLLNVQIPFLVDNRKNLARKNLEEAISAIGAGPGRRPSSSSARAFYEQFRESNEAVRAKWFPDQENLFSEDFDRYPEDADPAELSVDEAVNIAGQLWAVMR